MDKFASYIFLGMMYISLLVADTIQRRNAVHDDVVRPTLKGHSLTFQPTDWLVNKKYWRGIDALVQFFHFYIKMSRS